MNLNILTSGLITDEYGIRPALMCASSKNIPKHSVIRVLSEDVSGWVGIAYGRLITGAKVQKGMETLIGLEALEALLQLESGVFDLIELDTRLLGKELSQGIGLSIDELLVHLKQELGEAPIETLKKCQKSAEVMAALLKEPSILSPPPLATAKSEQAIDEGGAGFGPDDEDWDLGEGNVIESLQRQVDAATGKTQNTELALASAAETDDFSEAIAIDNAFPRNNDLSPSQTDASNIEQSLNRDKKSDQLGAELREELHAFVREKFGIDDKTFFKDVDLQDSKNYQRSIVLRDLETAMKRTKEELSSSASFGRLAANLEMIRKAEKGSSDDLASSPPSTTERRTYSEEDQEASRNIFTDSIRKNTEIDTKAFLSSPSSDDKHEVTLLKQKALRQAIMITVCICVLVSGTSIVLHSASRQSSLSEASDKLISGDYKGAKLCYEQILRVDPENWEAYLGHALSVPEDYKTQVKDFSRVLEIKPDEYSAAIALAKAHYELKEYRLAVLASDRALKLNNKNSAAWMIKGNSLMKLSRFNDASTAFQSALSSKPKNSAEINNLIADCYHELNQKPEEESYLLKALETDPKNPLYSKKLALLRIQHQTPAQAKVQLELALSLNSGDGELHYYLAKTMLALNELDKALSELNLAIDHAYANTESLGERGKLFLSKGMYGAAKADLEEALSKSPNETSLQKALSVADKQIELAKSRAGTRQLESESSQEALPVLQGNYVETAYELMKSGKSVSAARILKAALRLNPNDARARRYLANALYNNAEYPAAASQFAYAAAAQPLSADEALMYGRSLVKSEKYEQAIQMLSNLISEQPSFARARVELIKAYTLAGFTDHAREQCQVGMTQARNQQEYMEFKSLVP